MTTTFFALYIISLANGATIEAEGPRFQSFSECQLETDAQAKLIGHDLERAEQERGMILFKSVEGQCYEVHGPKGRIGRKQVEELNFDGGK